MNVSNSRNRIWVISAVLSVFYIGSATYLEFGGETFGILRFGALWTGFISAVVGSLISAAMLLKRYLSVRSLARFLIVPTVSSPIFTAPMLTHASPIRCSIDLYSNCFVETWMFTITLLLFSFGGFLALAISVRHKSK